MTLRDSFNRANPNTTPDALRAVKFGDVLAALPVQLRQSETEASAGVAASALVASAQQEPAALVLSAYARAGAGTVGALAVAAYPPAAGEVAVAPNGAVVAEATDAWTSLDVLYIPDKGEVVERVVSVDPGTGIATMPPDVTARGIARLLGANVQAGGFTGECEVIAPGASPAAAGQANLSDSLAVAQFRIADAVTSAVLRLLLVSENELTAQLAGTDPALI